MTGALPQFSDGFDLHGSPSEAERFRAVISDIGAAIGLWRLCVSLAVLDIKLRYRGSVLGPFWLTLSTGVMIGAMGILYATLFHMQMRVYFPFLALSIVLWNFLALLINDACQVFIAQEALIRTVRMPFMLYAARVVLRNLLVMAHNLIVVLVVDVALGNWPSPVWLLALPASVIWALVAVASVILIGALCARFRDIPPIVASVMQMAFFVSGVIWLPSQLGASGVYLALNPFFSFLEILRAPLLGHIPTLSVCVAAVIYAALITAAAFWLFARARGRLAFWV